MPVEASFYYSASYIYSGYIIHQHNSSSGRNHLICIVGWDDTFSYGGVTGAWIIKNSWGTSAGQSGYYYMTYGSSNLGDVGYFSSVSAADPNETIYYHDEIGMVNDFGYGGSSAWMASVFTASQAGRLTAADFWTTSNNAQYTIHIYNGQFGSQLATQSGTCAEQGFYSIPLTATVNLNAGQQFTVAVKLTTLGYGYPLPVEQVWSGYCNPPIQTGVSFVKRNDGDAWTDLGSTQQLNTCLRAWVVTTMTTPPAPILVSPANGSTQTGTSIPFSWNASPGNVNYDLEIISPSGRFFDRWVGNVLTYTVTGFPDDGSTFQWRVYAYDPNLIRHPASETRNFINGNR